MGPNRLAVERPRFSAVRSSRLLGAGDASLVRCVRIEDHGLLADFYFAVLEAASTLVHMQDSTGSGLLCVGKPEGARDRAFAEQALASANNHRKLPDAQRIDEIALEQGLEEVAAAVDLNLAAILCLELRDLLGNVALEQVRVVPGDLFERPRSDELRPDVEDAAKIP